MKLKKLLLFGLVAGVIFISGCSFSYSFHYQSSSNSHPRINIELTEGDREPISNSTPVIERQWTSPNSWHPKPNSKWLNLQVQYVLREGNSSTYITGVPLQDHQHLIGRLF